MLFPFSPDPSFLTSCVELFHTLTYRSLPTGLIFTDVLAHREPSQCTWTSQLKNLDLLSHAYTTTPNVILIFSVNNSKAFQGYARMASLPSPEIPTPSFSKPLIWESTDPFYLEWIAKNETGYGKVGHLKNPLNEGKPVFVGRDGQEIEREVGVELCAMLGMGGW